MSAAAADRQAMRAAISLARRGLGTTWPNPSVGCVILREGRVVGRGRTASGGRPHAEVAALADAGAAAPGATAYVTLEPCNHHGVTGPCTEALIASGIARVVVGAVDPDPRVDGGGIARLRGAGLAVEQGVLADEAGAVAAGFFSRVRRGRPLVTLKLATTLDGRIATKSGESRWITGEPARRAAHALRGRHDAVMVGVGTVLADDPELTCRIDGFRDRPLVRIVLDSHLRTPLLSRLVATARETPTWLVHAPGADAHRLAAFAEAGVTLIGVASGPVGVDAAAALAALGSAGLTAVLVEGGGKLAASLLRASLVDRLAWFHAPAIMGGDGWPGVQAFGVETMAAVARFLPVSRASWGEDGLTEMVRKEESKGVLF